MTNDEQINRAVAVELGWEPHSQSDDHWIRKDRSWVVPRFTTDYNAAAEMRKFVMQEPCIDKYFLALAGVLQVSNYSLSRAEVWAMMNATPKEQAEAFLRMRGKWAEETK